MIKLLDRLLEEEGNSLLKEIGKFFLLVVVFFIVVFFVTPFQTIYRRKRVPENN